MHPTTAIVRHTPPGPAVIVLGGDITGASEQVLADAHAQTVQSGARDVVLDFTDLAYMNSGGIGMLVTLLVRTQRNAQRLSAVGLSDHYRNIFSLTRLDEAITLYDDEGAALAALG